ncbi:putative Ig domain-containing protein [Horticoccus sp. 23ND18S-11]
MPAPVLSSTTGILGEVQGMITSVGARYVTIDHIVVTHDGDTATTFNGGLVTLAVGEVVNYTYTVDVDGVILATTMQVYPAQPVSGTERVSALAVTNATGAVALTLYNGGTVEYFQPYAFITGIGTHTSFGAQLVNFVGFVNPATGHILATSGYMSSVPAVFKAALPAATVGQAYNQYAIDLGTFGMGDVFSVSAAGLPPGMSNNMGVVSGVPTAPGSYVIAFDAMGGQHTVSPYTSIGSGNVTLIVNPAAGGPVLPDPVTPLGFVATVANGQVGAAYTLTNLVSSGVAPSAVTATGVPAGLTVSAAGILSGTPTAAGTYSMTLSGTDAVGTAGTGSIFITIDPAPVVTTSGAGIIGSVGRDFIVINGGLNAADHVFYTPTAATTTFHGGTTGFVTGEYVTFTGTVDGIGAVHATIMSVYPKVSFVMTLPSAQAMVAYAATNLVSTGTAPVFVGASGVPSGMNLSADGVLSGTPTSAGTFSITVVGTDGIGNSGVGVVTLVVAPAPVVVIPVTFAAMLSNGRVGAAYPLTNLVLTGVTPMSVAATGAPGGMTVSPTGILSGTPTQAGTYLIALSARDAAGTLGTGTATLVIAPTAVDPASYTSTGVKAEGKGVLASYNATSKTLTLNRGPMLRLTVATKVTLNDRATLSSIGMAVQYKGVKNTDGSVTLTSIEVN